MTICQILSAGILCVHGHALADTRLSGNHTCGSPLAYVDVPVLACLEELVDKL